MAGDPVSLRSADLPGSFYLSVILERRPSNSPWAEYRWQLIGVSAMAEAPQQAGREPRLVLQEGDVQRFQVEGFRLQLHVDECESYYYNLMSDTPRCFVMADPDEGAGPIPRRVSLSFDEAHAYLEVEQEVFAVDMPPELYRWVEAFVLANYVPVKKTKRKRQDWRKPEGPEVDGV